MKIGMVLSGGGAKGAYQIGLLKALEELGLRESIAALSGCSIGAVNALLMTGASTQSCEDVWRGMRYEDLMLREAAAPGPTEGGITRKLGEMVAQIRKKGVEISTLKELLADAELLPFSQDGMRRLMRRELDFEQIRNGPDIWVCAYNLEREEPQYFIVNQLPSEEIIELTMASSSIPMVFPPICYRGTSYCDGGITPPYSHKRNADKLPVKPLECAGCDIIIVVYLSHYDKVSFAGFPQSTRVLELYPSTPLEMIKGAGTLNLSKESLSENLLMGYHDGLAALAPMLLEQARGGSGDQALAAHAEYNRLLLEEKLPLLLRAEESLKAKLSGDRDKAP